MLIDVRVDYAKAGGPPDNWMDLVIMLDGVVVENAIEVDVKARWVKCLRLPLRHGIDGELETEKLTGHVLCYYTKEIENSAK